MIGRCRRADTVGESQWAMWACGLRVAVLQGYSSRYVSFEVGRGICSRRGFGFCLVPTGPENQGTRGPRDRRTTGPEDRGTRGPGDQRTAGPEDQRPRDHGPRDQGPGDHRATGLAKPSKNPTLAKPFKKKTRTP